MKFLVPKQLPPFWSWSAFCFELKVLPHHDIEPQRWECSSFPNLICSDDGRENAAAVYSAEQNSFCHGVFFVCYKLFEVYSVHLQVLTHHHDMSTWSLKDESPSFLFWRCLAMLQLLSSSFLANPNNPVGHIFGATTQNWLRKHSCIYWFGG